MFTFFTTFLFISNFIFSKSQNLYTPTTLINYYKNNKQNNKFGDLPNAIIDTYDNLVNKTEIIKLLNKITEKQKISVIISKIFDIDQENYFSGVNLFLSDFRSLFYSEEKTYFSYLNESIAVVIIQQTRQIYVSTGYYILDRYPSYLCSDLADKSEKYIINKSKYDKAIIYLLENLLNIDDYKKEYDNKKLKDRLVIAAIILGTILFIVIIISISLILSGNCCCRCCYSTIDVPKEQEEFAEIIAAFLTKIDIKNGNLEDLIKDNCILCMEYFLNKKDMGEEKDPNDTTIKNNFKKKDNFSKKNINAVVEVPNSEMRIINDRKRNSSLVSNNKDSVSIIIIKDNKTNLQEKNKENKNENKAENEIEDKTQTFEKHNEHKEEKNSEQNDNNNNYYSDEIFTMPGCEHKFHKNCIENWQQKTFLNCPICLKFTKEEYNGIEIRENLLDIYLKFYPEFSNWEFTYKNKKVRALKPIKVPCSESEDKKKERLKMKEIDESDEVSCCCCAAKCCCLSCCLGKVVGKMKRGRIERKHTSIRIGKIEN